jgi:hypothetical protein
MAGEQTKFGIGKETTYGTAVAVTVPFEIVSEDFAGRYERTQADALSAALVDRADRFSIARKGASGTVTLEVMSRNFGNWLNYLMGTVATSGNGTTTPFVHTATIASLTGKTLTVQVLRADETDTVNPWTYEGGKVTGFEFSNSVDESLKCAIEMDFELESNPDSPSAPYTLTALNALTIPTMNVMTWQEGTIRVGGTPGAGTGTIVDVTDISVKVDNSLNTDRYFIHQGQTKTEPRQDGKRKVEWSFTTNYTNNNFWEQVSSATIAGSYAVLNAKWVGSVAISGVSPTAFPTLEIEVPVARFDEGGPKVSGPSMLEQSFSGVGLYDGTNSAVTIKYTTADTTVI